MQIYVPYINTELNSSIFVKITNELLNYYDMPKNY